MAIEFARFRAIGRSGGKGGAVVVAAYIDRTAIHAERTNRTYDFSGKDDSIYSEVILPVGAPEQFRDPVQLWNAAAAMEKRVDSQEAFEITVALPRDDKVTDAQRIEMTRAFAKEHFVDHGLAAHVAVHAPHEGDKTENIHAHILVTTRRMDEHGFNPKKARDLNPAFRNGVLIKSPDHAWGHKWRDFQNQFFRANGIDLRVDDVSIVPQKHLGKDGARAQQKGVNDALANDRLRAEATAWSDPDSILQHMVRNRPTFTERDLNRALMKHIGDQKEAFKIRERIMALPDLVSLVTRGENEATGRYTTRQVYHLETQTRRYADSANDTKRHGVNHARLAEIAKRYTLREDQAGALFHATGSNGVAVIEGRAGVGKSHVANAIREAYEGSGYQVIGLAPTNTVARDMTADGFSHATTFHSELFRLKNGKSKWDDRTAIIADEAAMTDTKILHQTFKEAKRAGAKVILIGDDRQLASIEHGGMFTGLKDQFGSVAIEQVVRQKEEWQRHAAEDLAAGRYRDALKGFSKHSAICWRSTVGEARHQLVRDWAIDNWHHPHKSRFVFAYTNAEVNQLNKAIREVRIREDILPREGVMFQTNHGRETFSVGDRIQLTDTDKRKGLLNGEMGTVTAVTSGQVRFKTDVGQDLVFDPRDFSGFRLGYAGTIYRGQGKTIDQTYLLHSHHWRSNAAYVALTRQKENAKLYVPENVAGDIDALTRQIARLDHRGPATAYDPAPKPGLEIPELSTNLRYHFRRLVSAKGISEREAALVDLRNDRSAIEDYNRLVAPLRAAVSWDLSDGTFGERRQALRDLRSGPGDITEAIATGARWTTRFAVHRAVGAVPELRSAIRIFRLVRKAYRVSGQVARAAERNVAQAAALREAGRPVETDQTNDARWQKLRQRIDKLQASQTAREKAHAVLSLTWQRYQKNPKDPKAIHALAHAAERFLKTPDVLEKADARTLARNVVNVVGATAETLKTAGDLTIEAAGLIPTVRPFVTAFKILQTAASGLDEALKQHQHQANSRSNDQSHDRSYGDDDGGYSY